MEVMRYVIAWVGREHRKDTARAATEAIGSEYCCNGIC